MSDLVELYRCRECGKLSVSHGWLAAHVEKHRGFTRFNIQVPFTRTSPGNRREIDQYIERLQAEVVDSEVLA